MSYSNGSPRQSGPISLMFNSVNADLVSKCESVFLARERFIKLGCLLGLSINSNVANVTKDH